MTLKLKFSEGVPVQDSEKFAIVVHVKEPLKGETGLVTKENRDRIVKAAEDWVRNSRHEFVCILFSKDAVVYTWRNGKTYGSDMGPYTSFETSKGGKCSSSAPLGESASLAGIGI